MSYQVHQRTPLRAHYGSSLDGSQGWSCVPQTFLSRHQHVLSLYSVDLCCDLPSSSRQTTLHCSPVVASFASRSASRLCSSAHWENHRVVRTTNGCLTCLKQGCMSVGPLVESQPSSILLCFLMLSLFLPWLLWCPSCFETRFIASS